MQKQTLQEDSTHDFGSAWIRLEQGRNVGTATTTCENGITHAAIVSMGETSRVYFIPIHEEEESGGITPTPTHPSNGCK